MKIKLSILAFVVTSIIPADSNTVTWANASGSTAWYTAANWSPSTASSAWTTSDVATFANAGTANTAGINMDTRALSIGAIEVTSARTRNLTIGNSSSTSGNLTLNGATVNGVSNVILRNSSNSTLTLQNNETGSGKTMNVVLGNSTNHLIQIDGSGGVTISSNILGSSRNLTLAGSGSGVLTLSGVNSYTGTTTVSTGTLLLNGNSSAANGAVSVASGARLGGNGIVGGATTITGAHSPGSASATVGTHTFSSSLTYDPGSIFLWDLAAIPGTSTRGTDYDAVNAASYAGTGSIFRVVLNGSQNFSTAFWDTSRSWTNIFTNTDGTTNADVSTIFTSFQYYNSSGEVASIPSTRGAMSFTGSTLNWTPVPEPTSALAGLLLSAALLRRRRST
jgi:autotransporter-associated beta strand protein